MRTKKTLINVTVNLMGQLLIFSLAILTRSLMAELMPSDYLGVNGLFTNVLTIMSLAELGIGSAMLYALYKPVAENDQAHITMLMNLYRRLYRAVAVVVAVIGIAMYPLLPYLVHNDTVIQHLPLIYFMYVAQSVSSYFFFYKTALLSANQDQYIINIYSYLFMVLRYVAQIIILYTTHSFLLYLAAQIMLGIIPNILASRRAEKMFPFIRENRDLLPPKKERSAIFKNVRAMFMHKLGSVMVYSVDNLLMSALIGLSTVGVYSNYKTIVDSVSNLVRQLLNGIQNSVGNLVALEKDEERIYHIFKALNFAGFLFSSFCTVAMLVLFRPFIRCFFGEEYIFSQTTEMLILAQFYISSMRIIIGQFKDTMGLFWHDRYKPLAEVVVNLGLSWILAMRFGLDGILAATVIDLLLIPFLVEPLVLFKRGFKQQTKRYLLEYYATYFLWTLTMIAGGFAAMKVCDLVAIGGFLGVLVKGIVAMAVYGAMMLACYCWTTPFKTLVGYVMRMVKREGANLRRQKIPRMRWNQIGGHQRRKRHIRKTMRNEVLRSADGRAHHRRER